MDTQSNMQWFVVGRLLKASQPFTAGRHVRAQVASQIIDPVDGLGETMTVQVLLIKIGTIRRAIHLDLKRAGGLNLGRCTRLGALIT